MFRDALIKLLGGYTKAELKSVEQEKRYLEDEVSALRSHKEFSESISEYVGNYPVWKAQSDYRLLMHEMGRPLSGKAPFEGKKAPDLSENIDHYLSRLVEAFAALYQKRPMENPIFSFNWQDRKRLESAKGEMYLSKNNESDKQINENDKQIIN